LPQISRETSGDALKAILNGRMAFSEGALNGNAYVSGGRKRKWQV
jgi:hypothetical protein